MNLEPWIDGVVENLCKGERFPFAVAAGDMQLLLPKFVAPAHISLSLATLRRVAH